LGCAATVERFDAQVDNETVELEILYVLRIKSLPKRVIIWAPK
jgi:hypothetical protein